MSAGSLSDNGNKEEKMGNHYEAEKERILEAVRNMMENFGPYLKDCKLHWPVCYRCRTEMCQVIQKDGNSCFQCFERGCNGRKEWGI